MSKQKEIQDTLREIVAYAREGGHTWSSLDRAYQLKDDPTRFDFSFESLEFVNETGVEKPTVSDLVAKAHSLNKELESVYKQIFAMMKEGDIENESW